MLLIVCSTALLAQESNDAQEPGEPGVRVLALCGLYYDVYQCRPEFHVRPVQVKGWDVESVTVRYLQTRGTRYQLNAPLDASVLNEHDVVLLVNINVPALVASGFDLAQLETFVRQGGGLVILGGQLSFGGGGYGETPLETLSPLLPQEPFDLVQAKSPLKLVAIKGHPITRGVDFSQGSSSKSSVVMWHHRGTPRDDVSVVLRAGGRPLMVTRQVGQGRVVGFLGTVLGEPGEHQTAFWESPAWTKLLNNTLHWAGARKETSP